MALRSSALFMQLPSIINFKSFKLIYIVCRLYDMNSFFLERIVRCTVQREVNRRESEERERGSYMKGQELVGSKYLWYSKLFIEIEAKTCKALAMDTNTHPTILYCCNVLSSLS